MSRDVRAFCALFCLVIPLWAIAYCLSHIAVEQYDQTAALQQIAQSLQGKPPIQVTVDFGQQTGAMLTDALNQKPEKRGKK